MTVLAVPCINRPDLLIRLIESVDEPVTILVIDNSPDGSIGRAATGVYPKAAGAEIRVLWFPHNLGVAASWNLAIKYAPRDPFWLIANGDTELAPGDLRNLMAEAAKGGPRWVGMNGDWRVFAITHECVRDVGLFDENYYPVYCEDVDYEHRCDLAGVEWYTIPGGASHWGSAAISSGYALQNNRTYPANVEYHLQKWGSLPRHGEPNQSPFQDGGQHDEWALDIDRWRDLSWEVP